MSGSVKDRVLAGRKFRLSISVACLIGSFATAQTLGTAHAQQGPTQLPPVPIEPPARQTTTAPQPPRAPQSKAAKRRAPARPPAQQPAEQPAAPAFTPQQAAALPPGVIINPNQPINFTTAGAVQGYRALTAVSATKTNTSIEQIPQSIQVIPRSVINDQVSTSVSEATRNVSNVQPENPLIVAYGGVSPSIKIRGFGAEQWLDGLVNVYNTGDRDGLVNVERIEVLKGPNAILYGGGAGAPIGGAINVISKLPTDKARAELGVMIGSEKYWNPYFDINQPLNAEKTALFRFTGEYTGNKSFVDVLDSKRYNLNPTLTLTNKSDTTFTIQGLISKQEQQYYPGLPVYGTVLGLGSLQLPNNLFLGNPGIPSSYSTKKSITLTLDHQFDAVWSANVKARWSRSELDQLSQPIFGGDLSTFNLQTGFPLQPIPLFFAPPANSWFATNAELSAQQREFTINPNLQAKFTLGPVRNTVLIGADYSRIKDNGFLNQDTLGLNGCVLSFFFICPQLVTLPNGTFPPFSKPSPSAGIEYTQFNNYDNTYITKGAYGQLQSSFFDRVHVLVGGRFANIDLTYNEFATGNILAPASPSTSISDNSKFLPRAGVVVDVLRGVSGFVSYSEGMKWGGFVPVPQLKPEFSQQTEGGVKLNFDGQLSATLTRFQIERQNVPIYLGLANALYTSQKSSGYEADVIYQPNQNWSFLGSYGYTEAIFVDPFRANGKVVMPGNIVPGVPTYSGRFWANYKFDQSFLPGWSVGAGIYRASSQFVDSTNEWITQGYYTIDAKIGYEDDRFRFAVTAKNLTGQEYYTPYLAGLGQQVVPGAPRAYYGQFAIKFN